MVMVTLPVIWNMKKGRSEEAGLKALISRYIRQKVEDVGLNKGRKF